MVVFATILEPLIPLALGLVLSLVGVLGRKVGEALRMFVIRVCVPILVFFSIYEARANDADIVVPMVGGFLLMVAVMFFIGWLLALTQKDPARRTAVHLCVTFGNYGWMGLGVIGTLLDQEGWSIGTQHVTYFILAWWPVFYGVGLLIGLVHHRDGVAGKVPVKEVIGLVGAVVVALTLGLVLNAGEVDVPALLTNSLKPFGQMTAPLILFSVGLTLDPGSMRGSLRPALMVSAVVLLAGPLVGWGVGGLIAPTLIAWQVLLLEGTMPVATSIPLLEECYPIDMDLVGTCITVSTLLSLVTIPLVTPFVL